MSGRGGGGRPPSRRRDRLQKAMLAAGSLVAALALAEGCLQLHYRLRAGSWLWQSGTFRIGYTDPVDDRREYALKAGYRDPEANLTVDDRGFRSTGTENGGTAPVVVCLGDSVPFGVGVGDGETYCARLGDELAERGCAVDLLNAGVPSYNLRQSFDRLRLDVLPATAGRTALVLIDAANDVSLLARYAADWSPDHTWARERILPAANFPLALVHYARTPRRDGGSPTPPPTLAMSRARRHLDGLLREELDRHQAAGLPVVLTSINPFYYPDTADPRNAGLGGWSRHQPYVAAWDGAIRQHNALLREAADRSASAHYLDSRSALDAAGREGMFLDFIHYSRPGHEVAAAAILELIECRGLLSAVCPALAAKDPSTCAG